MSGEPEAKETKAAAGDAEPLAKPELRDAEKAEPQVDGEHQPRPRTRLIETPSTATPPELERLKPAREEVKVFRPAAPVRPIARTAHPEVPAVRYPGLERVVGLARKVIPVVQKMLPLLEGNVPLTVANLLSPVVEAPRRPVNLQPLEEAVDKLHSGQAELRARVAEQSATLQHLATQVEALQEQADRNAREREEMAEGLRKLRRRLTWVSWLGFVLLVALLAANAVLLTRVLGAMR
ncbi:MAG TPA: hypothetical protein VFU68_04755 [Terracidiphilus sp.]|nr:hypothetical protein [Terracidiphilus sp.]